MNLQPIDIQGQRICVITGKFLPTYACVQVDEQTGQIGFLFDVRPTPGASSESFGGDVVSTNQDVPSLASLHWYRPELLSKIYEVKANDLEFGLGCPLAVKEADLAEFRLFAYKFTPAQTSASAPSN